MRPTVPFTLALVALLAAPFGAAAAQEDLAWRLDRRQLSMGMAGDVLQFSSTRDSALGRDAFTGSFDPALARLDVRFQGKEPEAADAGLSVAWTALVEYRDADGDGRLSLSDPEVQRIALAGLPASVAIVPALGGQSAVATFTLPDNGTDGPLPGVTSGHGSVRVTLTLVPQPSSVAGGLSLGPTDLGLATAVDGMPFKAADSRLALVLDVSTAGGLPLSRQDGRLAFSTSHLTLGLAPDSLARGDDGEQPAPASTVSQRDDQALVMQELPRGDHAEHGSRIAVQRWQDDVAAALGHLPLGDWRFYLAGAGLVAVGLGIPSLRRLREP